MYRLRLTPGAQREFDKIQDRYVERIEGAIRKLAENPRPRGVKKLREHTYRIRTGDWRIIYAVFDREGLVIVGRIDRRSKDTYSDLEGLF